ncbi:MAG: DUF2271 domain-containing protein [Myxococcota bacterium]
MQLIRTVVVSSILALIASCESGGLSIEEPLAPDAPAADSGTTGFGDGGPAGGGLDGLDSAGGGDDGGVPGSTLVPSGARWRVTAAPASGWTAVDFDDAAWEEREAPLGSGYDVTSEWPGDGRSVYLRHTFDAEFAPEDILELRLRRDDGAIAYLDGVEVGRWNVAPGTSGSSASVPDEVQSVDGYTYFIALPAPPATAEGPHVLAAEIHQRGTPDVVFDARLRRLNGAPANDVVMIQLRTGSYGGNYAPDNVGAIWIEDIQGQFVRSLSVWGNVRREHLVAWFSRSLGDRVDAITAATASSHHSRLVEWDLRDSGVNVMPAGEYVVRFEVTEDNSNQGAPRGPVSGVVFSTAARCQVKHHASPSFEDVMVLTPCP